MRGQLLNVSYGWNQIKKIGAMNLLPLDWVVKESYYYRGFCLVRPGTIYRLNVQACIWRKDVLYRSILENEDAWQRENYGNIRNDVLCSSKIYSLKWGKREPFPYGFYEYGKINGNGRTVCQSAVEKGLWNIDVVKDVFKKNDITIDYDIRGINPSYNRLISRNNKLLNVLVVPVRKVKYRRSNYDEEKLAVDIDKIEQYVIPYLNYEEF